MTMQLSRKHVKWAVISFILSLMLLPLLFEVGAQARARGWLPRAALVGNTHTHARAPRMYVQVVDEPMEVATHLFPASNVTLSETAVDLWDQSRIRIEEGVEALQTEVTSLDKLWR